MMIKLKNTCILLSTLIFSLMSCSKNDSTDKQASIEGKWQYTKTGTISNNEEVLTNYQHASGCTKDYIEVLSTNVLKSHEFNNPNCQETIKTGTWNRSNNAIVIAYPGEPNINGEILELTNTTLKVKFVNSDITDLEILTRVP